MDIQTEVQKIHHQYGVSEKANYEIQKLFDKAIKEAVTEALRKHDVTSSYFMENRKKLYRVTLRGMTYNSTGVAYGSSYVIAENSDEAYKKVRKFLDENDLGITKDRELDKVELIADSYRYTDVGCLLHL